MNKSILFFALVILGTFVGANVCSQSVNADPHKQDVDVAGSVSRPVVMTSDYIIGDPHENFSMPLPARQEDVRDGSITGDPHNTKTSDVILPEEREPLAMPSIASDPHNMEEFN